MLQNDFFSENDAAVTKSAVKVLRWLVLVFPALMFFSIIGLFQSKLENLIPLTIVAIIVTMGPSVAYKLGAPTKVMKYTVTIALECLVILMASDSTIGIYMTYALAMVFSLFYYDKKFTLKISLISSVLLVVSLYFRSLNVKQIEFDTSFTWFVSRSVGFMIEASVMSLMCVKVAGASRKMLERLNASQQVASLVEKCGEASVDLDSVVKQLEGCIDGFRKTNSLISKSAGDTAENCGDSLRYVESVCGSMKNMDEAVNIISDKMQNMVENSDETSRRMASYVDMMEQTENVMSQIADAAKKTGESIDSLGAGINEVSGFADAIGRITVQTNLLALNAAIEAARSGEAGKGFGVVAGEVKTLAANSKDSSDAISSIIERLEQLLGEVRSFNAQNVMQAENGIKQIREAMQEARTLERVQEHSRQMAQDASASGSDVKNYSVQTLEMAERMRSLVENSLSRSKTIVDESSNQKSVTGNVEESFREVSRISKDLLEISSVKAG
ncbi:MAG: methyl-accepting chemotaxis protein [Huintestinicola sp.]